MGEGRQREIRVPSDKHSAVLTFSCDDGVFRFRTTVFLIGLGRGQCCSRIAGDTGKGWWDKCVSNIGSR